MRRLTSYLAALTTLVTSLHLNPSRRSVCGWLGASAGSALVPTPPAFAAPAPAAPTWTLTEVPGIGDEDLRSYGLLTLDNGLRAIICADDTQNRCSMAATLRCGSLDDPPGLEGLAHLTEHVTVAADPDGLQSFVDEFEGDVNAFTGERTTTFFCQYDLQSTVGRASSAAAAERRAESSTRDAVRSGCNRFAALFDTAGGGGGISQREAERLVVQEVPRVDAEMSEIVRAPSRRLVELAALKARASTGSPWHRLGRGDASTLPVDDDAARGRLGATVRALRSARYTPATTTVALVSPLTLEEGARLVAEAFATPTMAPLQVEAQWSSTAPPAAATTAAGGGGGGGGGGDEPRREQGGGRGARTPREVAAVRRFIAYDVQSILQRAADAEVEPQPFPDFGRAAGGAMGVVSGAPGRRACLGLAWTVLHADPLAASRLKPLGLVGHALAAPHAGSLAAALRARGLCPLEVEAEPVVVTRTLARADSWVIWQLEITLAAGADARWREAASLAVAAVERLAQRGVPRHSVAEAVAATEAAWRYRSRAPTATELAGDLQDEIEPLLAVTGTRLYTGGAQNVGALAAAADAAAAQLAARSPTVTVWAAEMAPLGIATATAGQAQAAVAAGMPLPAPLGDVARLFPLRLGRSPSLETAPALMPYELTPPPPNPWAPTTAVPTAVPIAAAAAPAPAPAPDPAPAPAPADSIAPTIDPTEAVADSGVPTAATATAATTAIAATTAVTATATAATAAAAAASRLTLTPLARQMPTRSYRLGSQAAATDERATEAEADAGLGVLQLGGCVTVRSLGSLGSRGSRGLAGSRAVLAEAFCVPRSSRSGRPRPFGVAVLQIASGRPKAAQANPRQQARGELWRLSLLQAVAETAAQAAYAGLKLDVSFNARGVRLAASGYSQHVPRLLEQLLRAALRHAPPPASSAELAATRRAALAGLRGRLQPAGLEAELRSASPAAIADEAARLWGSVRGAQLLLAGDIAAPEADRVAAVVAATLTPLLPLPSRAAVAAAADDEPLVELDDELLRWSGLLYKPSWTPQPLAGNICLNPAIYQTLDQCGSL